MIKLQIKKILDDCFAEGVASGQWSEKGAGKYTLEIPKRVEQGDYATNMALVLAGIERKNPREIANILAGFLDNYSKIVSRCEIAGPGFVNLFLNESVWQEVITPVYQEKENFGKSKIGNNKKTMVEFVSANPTGPLSIGHGRQAILGDAISRLLEATGHDVYREYYYNDAGRQMRVLGESTRARYHELIGSVGDFPEDGYQGDYIFDIAKNLVEEFGESLKDEKDIKPFKKRAEELIFTDISSTLARMGIVFDNYYNERSLYDNGHIDSVVSEFREKGLVYEKDDALWFETTKFGQEKDRVIIKSTGEPTYRLPDIAYHREKFRRNFEWMIDIFGADHIATVPDVMSGLKALGYDDSKVKVILHQFVTLVRGGKQVKMSTRKATFITVDELLDEVGSDVVRFFFMMRKADSQLEFDIDLAKKESQENPVYYVQYGHARICSILRQAEEKNIWDGSLKGVDLSLMNTPEDISLLKNIAQYPQVIENAALELSPHKVIYFLRELAGEFHHYYNKNKIMINDIELCKARLALAAAVRQVLKNALTLLGMNAPEKM